MRELALGGVDHSEWEPVGGLDVNYRPDEKIVIVHLNRLIWQEKESRWFRTRVGDEKQSLSAFPPVSDKLRFTTAGCSTATVLRPFF